ncbi:MAG: hypothetical protein JWQ90_5251 [Hydrocarboniphaga sp.]|uniref:DUF4166 domain-containing protein n=1 Tax=Hydrocarboniphaga sp. TaxID=2033016 RepID=UPI00261A56B1|nr:DUF4166 domain-containing protein [Hydrocarboniphaga sp.]MDB5972801.1 hypothetical protein [Hydrocarboniphaga sp.]
MVLQATSRIPVQPLIPPTSTFSAARQVLSPADVDFEHLVGPEGWRRLAPDIRQRFTEKPTVRQPIRYLGVMRQVGGSPIGAVLAQCCRLIGTPFAPYRAADVPVAITLRHEPSGGVIWEREYRYLDRPAATVRSTKRVGDDGALLECVGFGLGMRLAVFEANRALHFLSLSYFWRVGRREFRLPALLSPGTAHVIHEDLGAGRFRFSMTIHHPLFGLLFDQNGAFERETQPKTLTEGVQP